MGDVVILEGGCEMGGHATPDCTCSGLEDEENVVG